MQQNCPGEKSADSHAVVQHELQRQKKCHQLFAELGRDIFMGVELDRLMEKVVSAIASCLKAECSQILELLPEMRRLRPRAWHGKDAVEAPRLFHDSGAICFEEHVLMEGTHPVLIGDFEKQAPKMVPARFGSSFDALSAAGIAIPGKASPHGVLIVYSERKENFDQDDLVFLQSLASLLAVAVAQRHADLEIQHLAYFDVLTGLPNRTLLADRIEQVISRARREHREAGVMFLDLDRFKSVNDTLGHSCGDELLKVTARRLADSVRRSDTVARLGGDEFVVVLSDFDQEEGLAGVAHKILENLARPVMLEDHEITTTVSIGIAVFPGDGDTSQTLLRHADIAMYQSKERGKNTYQFFSHEMNTRVQERLTLETSLRYALERKELFLLFQPQLDLVSGRLVGMEALLRWNHPDLGLLTPEKFIPVAEETGLILEIGGWVLDAACRQVNIWKDMGYSALRLAVNISGRQFNHPCFIDMVDHILESTGFDPAQLELELTESTIMENAEVTIMTLTDIKVRGLNLAIDDFGTGYSSLSYLKHFPFDRLKIAQSFVRDVTADPDNAAIVDAVIAVAHSLNIKVIAEGVETRQQLEFLRARHCDELQGYYFGRPLAPEKFQELLEAGFSLKDICPFDARAQGTEPV